MKTSIGLCGATGKTPEITIGQVKTVDYTQKASVEITGTRENPILNFNIPKGKDGAKLIVREYFNGDIQILNNLNELPEDTNSDSYGKTVMSVNGIKQLLEKINDVLTKANANTNAIGSLTSTVQNNKTDIETKLNNFKSDTDTKVQSINQTISELEQTIETKLNEELTKQVKALQDENKKLNDMIFENSLKERFEGSDPSISDTSNGVAVIETIKGQTIVTDAPTEENPNYKLIESVGDKESNKISILSHNKNLFNPNNKFISNGGGAKFEMQGTKLIGSYEFKATWVTLNIKVDGLKNGHQYALSCDLIKYHFGTDRIGLYEYNTNKRVGLLSEKIITIGNEYDVNDIYFRVHLSDGNKDNISDVILDKIQIEENTQVTEYQTYKEDKKEILIGLDGGLKSLPNGVCDTIEQKEDGFYLVQRVERITFNGTENWEEITGRPNTSTFYAQTSLSSPSSSNYCNNFQNIDPNQLWNSDVEGITTNKQTNIHLRISRTKLNTQNIDGLKQWLQDNPTTVYYELANAIETKLDIDTLKLKTFKDLTYITSENSIKPVLKGQATKDITTVIKNLQSKGAN